LILSFNFSPDGLDEEITQYKFCPNRVQNSVRAVCFSKQVFGTELNSEITIAVYKFSNTI